MKIYRINTKQQLPISLADAWSYFSDTGKLSELTPSWMHFTKTSPSPSKGMYPGMIVTYRLRPIWSVWFNWMAEITHVKEQELFVDEQRSGPFRFWHHEHHFKEVDNGVEIMDILHYALPFGIIGRAVHQLSVEGKMQAVFQYRQKRLQALFGTVSK